MAQVCGPWENQMQYYGIDLCHIPTTIFVIYLMFQCICLSDKSAYVRRTLVLEFM